MEIIVAEDEESIAEAYRMALECQGHKVTITKDGQECIEHYNTNCNSRGMDRDIIERNSSNGDGIGKETPNVGPTVPDPPFDVAIVDYRMPRKNGLEVAKEILRLRPNQRIIFASAYVKETLIDSVKQLNMVVELLQKPFELDVLIDTVEDRSTYEQLENLNVDIRKFKHWNPTHYQINDLLDGLLRMQDTKTDFKQIFESGKDTSISPNDGPSR